MRTDVCQFSSVFLWRGHSGAKFIKTNIQLIIHYKHKPILWECLPGGSMERQGKAYQERLSLPSCGTTPLWARSHSWMNQRQTYERIDVLYLWNPFIALYMFSWMDLHASLVETYLVFMDIGDFVIFSIINISFV